MKTYREKIQDEFLNKSAREWVNALVACCHGLSSEAGWWYSKAARLDLKDVVNNPQGPVMKILAKALVSQKLCLTHSEVSEAMEGDRKNLMDDKLPHRKMLEVELADAVIRIFDLAGAMNMDLGGALVEKLVYNVNREDHKAEAREQGGGKEF